MFAPVALVAAPQAAALLDEARAASSSDAVVVGEYERAFASNHQFAMVAASLAEGGIEVWLPEAGGVSTR